jgi:hypothetical protein
MGFAHGGVPEMFGALAPNDSAVRGVHLFR